MNSQLLQPASAFANEMHCRAESGLHAFPAVYWAQAADKSIVTASEQQSKFK